MQPKKRCKLNDWKVCCPLLEELVAKRFTNEEILYIISKDNHYSSKYQIIYIIIILYSEENNNSEENNIAVSFIALVPRYLSIFHLICTLHMVIIDKHVSRNIAKF